jgi:hypothetical protein
MWITPACSYNAAPRAVAAMPVCAARSVLRRADPVLWLVKALAALTLSQRQT